MNHGEEAKWSRKQMAVWSLLRGYPTMESDVHCIGIGTTGMQRALSEAYQPAHWKLHDRDKFLSALRKHWGEEKVLSLLLEMEAA